MEERPVSNRRQQVIDQLQLQGHVEGGYFRRTYTAQPTLACESGIRPAMSSIYYMLTADQPRGRMHLNRSDIMHYWHLGGALRYYLIYPNGELQTLELGPDLARGQQLQFLVPGGVWKATELLDDDFCLLSEAVCPGFDFADMTLANRRRLTEQFPQHNDLIERFTAATEKD